MLVDFDDAGKYRVQAEANGHTLTRSAQVRNSGKVTTVDGRDSRDEDLEKIVTNDLIHDELLQAIRSA